MPRTVRALLTDLFALTFGFAVASLSITVLTAARSTDPLRTAAPAASVLSPSQGQIVSGSVIVAATASLNTDALQFQLSGVNLGPAITSGACNVTWNTAAVNDGTYALTVLAFDAGGNMTPSRSVAVTVANNAPQITNVVMSNPTSTSVVITWTTNQVATSRVDYGVNSLTSSLPVNWNLVTRHSAMLSGLSPGTSYRFRASSSNGVGLSATSAVFTFSTAGGNPATSDPSAPKTPPPASTPGGEGAVDLPPPPSVPTTIDSVAVDPVLGVLANALVILERDGKNVNLASTDSDGRFRFTGLVPGHYRVLAWSNGPIIVVLDVRIR